MLFHSLWLHQPGNLVQFWNCIIKFNYVSFAFFKIEQTYVLTDIKCADFAVPWSLWYWYTLKADPCTGCTD